MLSNKTQLIIYINHSWQDKIYHRNGTQMSGLSGAEETEGRKEVGGYNKATWGPLLLWLHWCQQLTNTLILPKYRIICSKKWKQTERFWEKKKKRTDKHKWFFYFLPKGPFFTSSSFEKPPKCPLCLSCTHTPPHPMWSPRGRCQKVQENS